MDTGLGFEIAVRALAVDLQGHALDSGFLARLKVENAHFEALPFEEAASLDWTPAGLSEGVECISRDHGGRSYCRFFPDGGVGGCKSRVKKAYEQE